ncbi:MAG: ATP-binding protein [Candidatus Sericytochromatia bacterium]|nr:ATP-binding protein [Candidatus Sericytochromatia bacterium]
MPEQLTVQALGPHVAIVQAHEQRHRLVPAVVEQDEAHHGRLRGLPQPQGPHAQASGGAGLGPWLCRQVVEAHGGTLSVESDPASRPGATFRVEVPLASDHGQALHSHQVIAQPAPLG